MSTHTQWILQDRIIIDQTGAPVSGLVPSRMTLDTLRLVRAAPELLEALQAMCDEWRRHGCCDSQDVAHRAEQIIATAEGRG